MIKASDSRQVTDSTPIRSTYMAYNIAAWQVVHTHVPLTKQQNFMPAKGRGLLCSWKGKLTLGHWDGQKVGLMWAYRRVYDQITRGWLPLKKRVGSLAHSTY